MAGSARPGRGTRVHAARKASRNLAFADVAGIAFVAGCAARGLQGRAGRRVAAPRRPTPPTRADGQMALEPVATANVTGCGPPPAISHIGSPKRWVRLTTAM